MSGPFRIFPWGDPYVLQYSDLRNRSNTVQDFETLKNTHAANGTKFVDTEFPANDQSVGSTSAIFDSATDSSYSQSLYNNGWDGAVKWTRVADFIKNGGVDGNLRPYSGNETLQFALSDNFVETFSRMDVHQGMIGDCWFVASLSAVATNQTVFSKCVPSDNVVNDAGIYHFRFWYQGIWVDTVVDDFIPYLEFSNYRSGSNYKRQLGSTMVRSGQDVEFWVTLAEKAFAKIEGKYELLSGNSPVNALEPITGGFGDSMELGNNLKLSRATLEERIQNSLTTGGMLALSSFPSSTSVTPIPADHRYNGIFYDHAYSITGMKKFHYKSPTQERDITLVRIRNPHGQTEWNGAFSDNDGNWQYIEGLTNEHVEADEGEFWMPFENMLTNFTTLSSLSYILEDKVNQPDSTAMYGVSHGKWSVSNGTAGGYTQPWLNPQYPINVGPGDGTGSAMIIAINLIKGLTDFEKTYGFRVYKLTGVNATKEPPYSYMEFMSMRDGIFQQNIKSIDGSNASYQRQRSVVAGFKVEPGKYLLEVFLNETNQEGEFVLRILNTA